MPGILGLLKIGHLGNGRRFQRIDLAEQLHEMPDVRFAKLRHARIQVIALTFPAQQNVGEPFGFQLRSNVSQRRR